MRVFYKLRLMFQYYTKQLVRYYHEANRKNYINNRAREIIREAKEHDFEKLNNLDDLDKTGS